MSNLDDFRSSKINTWPIVMLRIYTGIFFLYHGAKKIGSGFGGENTERFLGGNAEEMYSFYKSIVDAVVVPLSGVFGFLVAWGELLLGIALILGLMTRWAAVAGAFMVLNFGLAKGQDLFGSDFIWMVILIVLAGLHAGRTMSLDAKLAGKYKFLA